jgi:ketosteroid isomerase-like protein
LAVRGHAPGRQAGASATAGELPTTAAQASSIEAARLRQNTAIADHKVDEIASYWTDDVTICRGLGIQLAGMAAYRKLFEGDDPTSPEQIVYERIPTSIDVATVWPLAFETGTWQGHRGASRGPVVIQGRYSAQWVNRGGRWLIRSEVFVALSGSGPGLQMKAAP